MSSRSDRSKRFDLSDEKLKKFVTPIFVDILNWNAGKYFTEFSPRLHENAEVFQFFTLIQLSYPPYSQKFSDAYTLYIDPLFQKDLSASGAFKFPRRDQGVRTDLYEANFRSHLSFQEKTRPFHHQVHRRRHLSFAGPFSISLISNPSFILSNSHPSLSGTLSPLNQSHSHRTSLNIHHHLFPSSELRIARARHL